MTALALILFAVVPRDCVLRESVDLIELNHFYDEQSRSVFDQAIFYDWDGKRYQVRAWRLVKHPAQIPQREWPRGYSALWLDGEVQRRVWAQSMRETWTTFDPELLEREILPKEKRRELDLPQDKRRPLRQK